MGAESLNLGESPCLNLQLGVMRDEGLHVVSQSPELNLKELFYSYCKVGLDCPRKWSYRKHLGAAALLAP